jgi:hypothetical protein
LVDDSRRVECPLGFDDSALGRLQDAVEAAQDGEREDHVAVLAANVEVAQNVVGNRPDQGDDSTVARAVHPTPLLTSNVIV